VNVKVLSFRARVADDIFLGVGDCILGVFFLLKIDLYITKKEYWIYGLGRSNEPSQRKELNLSGSCLGGWW
jgi:hypothetical protein